jgi:hypothetical protein
MAMIWMMSLYVVSLRFFYCVVVGGISALCLGSW